MSLKYIQVTAPAARAEALRAALADRSSIVDLRLSGIEDGERTLHLVAGPQERQELFDDIQARFGPDSDWRMIALPVEASVPPARGAGGCPRAARLGGHGPDPGGAL